VRMTVDVDVTVFPGDRTVEALTKVVEAHGFELRGADAVRNRAGARSEPPSRP
jgi:hypothetical protein